MKQNIISGFKATGIFPYDKLQVLKKLLETSSLQETSSNDQEKILSTPLLDYLKTTRAGNKTNKNKKKQEEKSAMFHQENLFLFMI